MPSLKWAVPLIAATLNAGELDPRLLRLIGPATRFVWYVDHERLGASELGTIIPTPYRGSNAKLRFSFGITDSAGRTLTLTTFAEPVRQSDDEPPRALLDPHTLLDGDDASIAEAAARWNERDLPKSVAAEKARSLANSYDAWFLGIRPLDIPIERPQTAPFKHREELIKAIDEIRAGVRFGAVDDALVEIDARSADEANALAVFGRYLPGLLELAGGENAFLAIFNLADRTTVKVEGRTASLAISVAEFRLAEWVRAQNERREKR